MNAVLCKTPYLLDQLNNERKAANAQYESALMLIGESAGL